MNLKALVTNKITKERKMKTKGEMSKLKTNDNKR